MNKDVFSDARMGFDKYLEYLEIHKNVSIYTLRNYRYCLDRFFRFVQKTVLEIDAQDILNFRIELNKSGSGTGKNWATYHIIVLREYLKWCARHDYPVYAHYKIETPKYEERVINVQDRASLEKLFHISHPRKLISLRNTAIIHTLYSTGCRVSELRSLSRHKIGNEISIMGKGKKVRLVFLSPRAKKAIKNYMKARNDDYSPLFISHGRSKGAALTTTMIELIMRKYAKKAGITRTTPHSIRHTFATQLLKNGAPLPSIQEMLGHSSIRTTQIYLHVTNPELQRTHQSFHR